MTVTRWTPIGLGRSGERVLKTPVSGMVGSPAGWVCQDVAVGEVEPGEHDELVAGLDAMEGVGEGGVDLEGRFGCAFERLVGRVGGPTQRRVDDADWMHQVGLAFAHRSQSRI